MCREPIKNAHTCVARIGLRLRDHENWPAATASKRSLRNIERMSMISDILTDEASGTSGERGQIPVQWSKL